MTEPLIATRKWKPQCQAADCDRTARTAGYCPRHYQQVRRHGRLTPEREYHSRNGICCAGNQVGVGHRSQRSTPIVRHDFGAVERGGAGHLPALGNAQPVAIDLHGVVFGQHHGAALVHIGTVLRFVG